jgi:hypothetical protein
MDVRILIGIMVILIVGVHFSSSKFNNVHPYLDDEYECGENKRLFPEGNIPGDYLVLNKYEIDNLTQKFNLDKDRIINEYIDDRY